MKKTKNEYMRSYTKTIHGLISRIYYNQTSRCRIHNWELPKYNIKQLKEWILSQINFNDLYENWVNSNYKKELSPSIDRKDDYKGYSLSNIQLMTWQENNNKYSSDAINGVNTKNCKAVLQFDLKNNFIKEYYSMNHAERCTGIFNSNISAACSGKYKTMGGFIWTYK